jgi:transcriptional regulator with XRE-family HTH domain
VLHIKFDRTDRGISQGRLAKVAKIHQPSLSKIERGLLIPTPAELQRLADALGVDADVLLQPVCISAVAR